jgi:hypothetical protein
MRRLIEIKTDLISIESSLIAMAKAGKSLKMSESGDITTNTDIAMAKDLLQKEYIEALEQALMTVLPVPTRKIA